MTYYSQFGQDQYLWENYFQYYTHLGKYVDIGAHDGITGSNTKFFEVMGWEGICFEPIPHVYEQLVNNRACTRCRIAIGDFEGKAQFRVIKGHSEMLSGLEHCYTQQHKDRINQEMQEHQQEYEMIEVTVSRFETQVFPYGIIDYLSVDTEGSEEMIIRSIPLNKYFIKFMSVEFNPGAPDSLHQYLLNNGFEFIKDLGCDRIYKNKLI